MKVSERIFESALCLVCVSALVLISYGFFQAIKSEMPMILFVPLVCMTVGAVALITIAFAETRDRR